VIEIQTRQSEWQASAKQLAADHCNLLKLEAIAAQSGSTPKILSDLNVVCTAAIRVLWLAFEEDKYHHGSHGGLHLLRGMLQTLPDSKIVEDCHGNLRKNAKKGSNKRQTLQALQELVTSSSVLQTRDIKHKAFVTREEFLRRFPRTKDRKRKRPGVLLYPPTAIFVSTTHSHLCCYVTDSHRQYTHSIYYNICKVVLVHLKFTTPT